MKYNRNNNLKRTRKGWIIVPLALLSICVGSAIHNNVHASNRNSVLPVTAQDINAQNEGKSLGQPDLVNNNVANRSANSFTPQIASAQANSLQNGIVNRALTRAKSTNYSNNTQESYSPNFQNRNSRRLLGQNNDMPNNNVRYGQGTVTVPIYEKLQGQKNLINNVTITVREPIGSTTALWTLFSGKSPVYTYSGHSLQSANGSVTVDKLGQVSLSPNAEVTYVGNSNGLDDLIVNVPVNNSNGDSITLQLPDDVSVGSDISLTNDMIKSNPGNKYSISGKVPIYYSDGPNDIVHKIQEYGTITNNSKVSSSSAAHNQNSTSAGANSSKASISSNTNVSNANSSITNDTNSSTASNRSTVNSISSRSVSSSVSANSGANVSSATSGNNSSTGINSYKSSMSSQESSTVTSNSLTFDSNVTNNTNTGAPNVNSNNDIGSNNRSTLNPVNSKGSVSSDYNSVSSNNSNPSIMSQGSLSSMANPNVKSRASSTNSSITSGISSNINNKSLTPSSIGSQSTLSMPSSADSGTSVSPNTNSLTTSSNFVNSASGSTDDGNQSSDNNDNNITTPSSASYKDNGADQSASSKTDAASNSSMNSSGSIPSQNSSDPVESSSTNMLNAKSKGLLALNNRYGITNNDDPNVLNKSNKLPQTGDFTYNHPILDASTLLMLSAMLLGLATDVDKHRFN